MRLLKQIASPGHIALLISAGLFALYCSVLPQRLTGVDYAGDGGDFVAAMLTGGVPHPTGYPTYMVLGRLFQLIPLGSPYFRAALLSAAAAAAAAGLFFLWLKAEFKNIIAAAICTVAWGVSPLLWSQAVIVEVHALQAFFIMIVLWWFRLVSRTELAKQRRGTIAVLTVCLGLAAGNHVTIWIMAPVFAYGLVLGWKNGLSAKSFLWLAIFILVGFSIYLYLPLMAQTAPAINWGGTQSFEGFLWEITGSVYRGLIFDLPLPALLGRLSAWAKLLLDQFGLAGFLVGLLGLAQSVDFRKPLNLAILWMFVSYTLFSVGYNTNDSLVYLIPAIIAFAIWLCQGVCMLMAFRWRAQPAGAILTVILVILVSMRIMAIRNSIDPRRDQRPANFAESLLKSAPKNALVLTKSDADSFPLWYYHFGLGWRMDLRVVVVPLTYFAWYRTTLNDIYPDLVQAPHPDGTDAWGESLARSNPLRPVCHTQPDPDSANGVRFNCDSGGSP